jgi:hypothetical protein
VCCSKSIRRFIKWRCPAKAEPRNRRFIAAKFLSGQDNNNVWAPLHRELVFSG